MIYVAICLFVVALIATFVWAANRNDENVAAGGALTAVASVLLAVVLAVMSCITVVKPGNVGVEILFGHVKPDIHGAGLHFVNPFCSIEKMSVQTDNYWMSHNEGEGDKKHDDSVSVRSSNGLQMPVDVSVPYRLIPEAAPWVYENLGKDYVEKILRVSLSTACRRAASHFTAEELYSNKRDQFAEKTRELLHEELNRLLNENYKGKNPPEQVLVVSQILIGHVGIPDTVKNAIETKLKGDQEQQAMDFKILKEKKEAERKRVEAEGIKTFQDIVSKGIDEKLLRWKAIDATLHLAESPNSKVIIIGAGGDGLPVLLGSQQLHEAPKK